MLTAPARPPVTDFESALREESCLLRGKIQMDDSYLGRELPGGKAGRGSENMIPIVPAVSLNEAGHPIHARITSVSGFCSEAIAEWAKRHLMPGSHVLSDGLACFRAVTTANCHHKSVVTGGKHSNDLTQFRRINTLLGNLKTSFCGTFHAATTATRACGYDKFALRYLGGFCFRFNRRFLMAAMTERIANAVCFCTSCTERDLRFAEAYE